MHFAECETGMGQREDALQLGPGEERDGECLRMHAAAGIGREPKAMAGDEFEEPRQVVMGRAEIDQAAGDREIGIREAVPTFAKLREEGAILSLLGIEQAKSGALNFAGMAKKSAHQRGWRDVFVVCDLFLRIEVEDVVIAAGKFVQHPSEFANVGGGFGEFSGNVEIGIEAGKPAQHLVIAQATGTIFHVGFQVEDGVAEAGVAVAGQAREAAEKFLLPASQEAAQSG